MALYHIVHGQIKLTTVLVNLQGQVKLCKSPTGARRDQARDDTTCCDLTRTTVYPQTYTIADSADQLATTKDIQAVGQVVCNLTNTPRQPDQRLETRTKSRYSDDLYEFVTATNTESLTSVVKVRDAMPAWCNIADLDSIHFWPCTGTVRICWP